MPKGVYIRKEPSEKMKESHRKRAERIKGKCPYKMTDEIRQKISKGLMGNIPPNKGIQREDILKKVERYKLGLEIECKNHGFHHKWNLHSENNVKCLICTAERNRILSKKEPLRFILRDARQHSKKYNRKFEITLDDLKKLIEIQGNKCALSDIEFNEETRPSLDRIDSGKGYEKNNIQLVTIEINRMKSNLPQHKFLDLCFKVTMSEAGMSNKNKKGK